MAASSTSSSDRAPRARTRHRRALLATAAAVAACLALTWPLNAALVRNEFDTSVFGRTTLAAAAAAEGRPLVAILGSSQTQTGIDARRIEDRLAGAASGAARADAPVVVDIATGGLHASVYPHLLRELAARARLDRVVLELGHIAHDQYGGATLVRNFLDDAPVREAFRGTPRGDKLIALWEDEHRFPWLATPRLLRVGYDGLRRTEDPSLERRTRESRGFAPYTTTKDFEDVVRALEHDPAYSSPDLLDASPQKVFVEVARACADVCRERGVPMVVLLQPVNRAVAARIKVVRHFEETAKSETVPALRALGIRVLVPPDRFYESSLYYDHVHLRRDGAEAFTDWLAEELVRQP